mmetsp:Transcript_3630/g.5813  ORF Transcript_3630/g.5813 Transcript_3630/m.5813 type:complete len:86 (+) Transcript_3630:97-354(+)
MRGPASSGIEYMLGKMDGFPPQRSQRTVTWDKTKVAGGWCVSVPLFNTLATFGVLFGGRQVELLSTHQVSYWWFVLVLKYGGHHK